MYFQRRRIGRFLHLSLRTAATLLVLQSCFQLHAAVYTWDANSSTTGAQDGAGTWLADAGNWFNTTTPLDNQIWPNLPGAAHVAQFGAGGPTAAVVTLSGNVNVSGINFLTVNAAFGNNAAGYAVGNNAGTITFDDNSIINLADGISGANTFVQLNPAAIVGNSLTFQKFTGSANAQRIRIGGTNTNLLGTLTVRGTDGGVTLQVATSAAIQAVTKIAVESGGALQLIGGTDNYTRNLELAGTGISSTGALLFTGDGIVQSGNILLKAASSISRGTGNVTATISGVISEESAGLGLTFLERGNVILTNQNTYTGTTANRATTVVPTNLTLDFTTLGGDQNDILYHGAAAPGDFRFEHIAQAGLVKNSLVIQGAATGTNSQHLGNVTVGDSSFATIRTSAALTLLAGNANTLNLTTGTFSKGTLGSTLRITGPVSGTITANNGTSTNGLIGPFVVFVNSADGSAGWAGVTGNVGNGGTLGVFTGDTLYSTDANLTTLGAAANAAVSSRSSGNVVQTGNVAINTLTMRDTIALRTVTVGTGNTLRLGENGGVQIVAGGVDLTIGAAGNAGTLTAGNASVAGANDLYLTNSSSVGTLTINSVIANNGANGTNDVVHLVVNGSGKVVLAGGNTFTGNLTLHGGILELRSNTALGTSAGTNYIYDGAQLQLSGSISIADAFSADGTGSAGDGAIRSLSGNNTLAGVVTGFNTRITRFTADAGSTLNFNNGGAATAAIINGNGADLVFGGAGTIIVANRLANGVGSLTKEGSGTLVLNGNNNFTGVSTINGGVVRVGNANAFHTAVDGAAITVNDGGTLEFVDGISMLNDALTLVGAGAGGQGALRLSSGNNTYAGVITILGAASNNTAVRITVDSGATLTLSHATAAIQPSNNANRSVILGGAGVLNITGVVANFNTRVLPIVKDGSGSVNYRNANTYTGATTVSDGVLRLDFANATPTANLIFGGNSVTLNGGTLNFAGKASATNTQLLTAISVGAGRSSIEMSQGAGGTATLNAGSISRVLAAVLDFNLAAGGTLNTTTPNATSTFGGSFTVNKNTWAVSGATLVANVPFDIATDRFTAAKSNGDQVSFTGTVPAGITAGQTYYVINSTGGDFQVATTLGGTTPVDLTTSGVPTTLVTPGPISGLSTFAGSSATNDFITDGNIDVVASSSQAVKSINSLRFNTAGAATVTLTGTLTLPTVVAGGSGILVTSNVGANNSAFAGTAQIRAGAGNNQEFIFHQHNTAGSLVFGSGITLVGGNNARITKTGAGDVLLQGLANSSNVQLYVHEGSFTLEGNNRLNNAGLPNLFLGSGSSSGKLILRALAATNAQSFDGITVSGSGTANAIVGGSALNYTLRLSTSTFDLTQVKLGGAATNENNLNLAVIGGAQVTLGPGNTFAGSIRVDEGRLLVTAVADPAFASSFGDGSSAILLGESNISNLVVGLEYAGIADGSTSRAIEFTNNQTPGLIGLTLELASTGIGSIAYTGNIANTGTNLTDLRTVRLTGTNTGMNSIAGVDALLGATTNLDKAGLGRWIITGTSNHNGATNVVDGTLQLGNGGTGGGLAASSGISLGALSSRLRTSRSNTLVIAQKITGIGGVEIANTSTGRTVVTNATNDYSGPTTVSSGTLTVDGAIAGSGVVVGPGGSASLNGNGAINSLVRVAAGASFSAGASAAGRNGDGIGQITLAAGLTWEAGSSLVFDFSTNSLGAGGAGTDWDFIHLTGGVLKLTGDRFTVYVDSWNETTGYGQNANGLAGENFDPTASYQWRWLTADGPGQRIVDADGNPIADGTLGMFQFVADRDGTGVFAPNAAAYPQTLGGQFWVNKSGNDLYINYAAVPEPGSLVFLSVAAAGFALRRQGARAMLRRFLAYVARKVTVVRPSIAGG
ncbi:MAG: hypothetical protein C0483_08570 [Pirellula sp.]|nr:hypothetical protein [Pirellula sp.]